LVLTTLLCTAAPLVYAGQLPDARTAKAIEQALAYPAMKHGIKGVLVKSLDTGAVIYEKNSEVLFVPASNFKLVATAAAIDLLGPNYRMRTSLLASAKPSDDGILNGNLILVGKGDPVLRFEDLQGMVDKLKEMGVKTIDGDIIGDDSWFDNARLGDGWQWTDLGYYYAAEVSALNLNENSVELYARPGMKDGDPASIRVQPATGYMYVKNQSITTKAGSKSTIDADRTLGRNTILVTGNIPIDSKTSGSIETISVADPTLFACNTLREMIERAGIKFTGNTTHGVCPNDALPIATHYSPPLSTMLALVNKPSDNLIAECLFKTVGRETKGLGTAAAAREAETEWLKKIGANLDEIDIQDGSGLSRQDVISPRNIVTLLGYMYRSPNAKFFVDSLPVAGVDGTLKYRMKGTSAEGNVKAKTGTLNHVRSLSGFVTTKAGENLVFSILMNNHTGGADAAAEVQNKIAEALADMTTKTGSKSAQTAQP
jgi:PBP4 family serine-type D-alanyl-D-alanine carboxypeptidase